ncbi:MAG: hypothetical protein M3437_20840 [Chloroflexota bacterium]|nr:hypothetical protein [Chloroflexota bacterium]MDQ5865077.1 hypothetical protein [Chloroflexota bacterium]
MSRFALVKLIPFQAAVLAAATLSIFPLSACNQAGGDTGTPVASVAALTKPTKTPGDKMKPQPEDFSVTYEWRAGTMPPPYHYEYSIRIGPGTEGQIVYQPDYDFDKVPRWTEPVTVTKQQLADLYALVLDRKLLREKWGNVQDPPVGGSVQWAEITAHGKTHVIPTQLKGFQEDAAATLYDAVKALVPQATWDKLEARREQYVQEYQNKNGD